MAMKKRGVNCLAVHASFLNFTAINRAWACACVFRAGGEHLLSGRGALLVRKKEGSGPREAEALVFVLRPLFKKVNICLV